METETTEPQINGKVTPPPAAEAPKRRGRPPGSTNKPKETLSETSPGDSARRGPGRPRKVHTEIDPAALARQIKGAHGTVAFFFGLPELVIDDKEATELANAFANFAREFDFEPNPKVMATVELIGVAGFIYTPRVIHIAQRVKATKAKRAHTINSTATHVADDDVRDRPAN